MLRSWSAPDCGKPFPVKKKRSRTDDLKELLPSKPKQDPKTKKMHSLLRKAHKQGYLPSWAGFEFEKAFGHAANTSNFLHALVERPEPKDVDQYATYLGLLCKKKDRSWSFALGCLVREFGPEFMEGRVAHAREIWQYALDNEPMTLQSAAFDAPRATGPREGSVAYDVLRTLEAKQPLPLSIRAIAADIGSRRHKDESEEARAA